MTTKPPPWASVMRVIAVEADRDRTKLGNPVINYRYVIYTGARCTGIESRKRYSDRAAAYNAGVRTAGRLYTSILKLAQGQSK